jgi:hypothetical protein
MGKKVFPWITLAATLSFASIASAQVNTETWICDGSFAKGFAGVSVNSKKLEFDMLKSSQTIAEIEDAKVTLDIREKATEINVTMKNGRYSPASAIADAKSDSIAFRVEKIDGNFSIHLYCKRQ